MKPLSGQFTSGLVLVGAAFLAAGCGAVSQKDGGDGTDASLPSIDGGAGIDANTICDEQDLAIVIQPTRLMLALDMSGSMAGSPYSSARQGIVNAITNLSGLFHFGFNSYPRYPYSGQCTIAGTALFDAVPGNETGILDWLASHEPQNGAGDPLVIQMDALLNNPSHAPNFVSQELGGESYLVIVADGDDCCGPAGAYTCSNEWTAELVDRTQQLLTAGIKTIVVGYAGADSGTMNAIAAAGGSPFSTFLPAGDQTALQNALQTIGDTVASCTFTVDVPDGSADPDALNLYIDDVLLPFDAGCSGGSGWDWANVEHTSVRLCTAPCESLRTGNVDSVTAKFGCPSVVVE